MKLLSGIWLLVLSTLIDRTTQSLTTSDILKTFLVSSEEKLCPPHEFHCPENKCISSSKRCDGIKDCTEGADELNCESVKCLPPDYFKCALSKQCISSFFVCDKSKDCEDGSDEMECHVKNPTRPCSEGEFKCSNGACIPTTWHCDRNIDCDDGSDEDMEKCREKTSCTEGFLCKNLNCVSTVWRCDGKDDCGDGSDETDCELRMIEPDQCLNINRKFLCHDRKKCIDIESVCNSVNDCLDSSDEGGICNTPAGLENDCKAANCTEIYQCLRKPHGIMCVCPKGTNFSNNACRDINECEQFGVCDQYCTNTFGSNTCYCDSDYELKDNHSCKIKGEEPILIYSSLRQIKSYNLVTNKSLILVDKLQQATGIAMDDISIYWTIIYDGSQAIVRASKKEEKKPEIIVTSGLGTPENLAIDSITRNLYFTDAKMKHIGVCNNDGTVCTVLHNKDIDKPRAIAVSPDDGYMYWSDWGDRPMIAKSGMDGSQPTPFITQDIHWPNGIHVDYLGKRIYWVDAKMQMIESSKFDASDRKTILTESVEHPFSVTVFEDKLYWSDWSGKEIKVCNKFTGRGVHSVVREAKTRIYGMQIYHPSLFKAQIHNPCVEAKCSDICLLAPKKNGSTKGYTCACPDDKILTPGGFLCVDIASPPTLIVGTTNGLLEVEHEHLGRQKIIEIPLKNKIPRISALVYNSLTGNIIIFDSKSKKISTYDLLKMKLSDLVTSELGVIHSLKFDNHGNNLYWCDWTRGTLNVLSMTTKSRTVLLKELDGHIPIAVALVPDQGYMFVAMKDGSHLHIDRINMDGNIKTLVHSVEVGLLEQEIILHFDTASRRLYFTYFQNGIIESVNQDGLDRKIFKNAGSIVDIVSLGHEIFWVERGSKYLHWMDKNSGDQSSRMIEIDVDNWLPDSKLCLTAVNGIDRNIQHPCLQNNGGCSHLCLVSGKGKTCGCPIGMVLSENGQDCIPLKQCSSDEFRCSTGECILSRFRCDRKIDCPHGDDEDTVQCEHFVYNSCPKSQFMCRDQSQCLDKKLLCNGIKDCTDGSDEMTCGPKHLCDPTTEFLCTTGECIEQRFVCDGNSDCSNGQDEYNCQNHTCHHLEFRCNSGTCIAAAWECDGEPDCSDSSDEHNSCHIKKCKADQYTCSNGRCISHKFTCNGNDDCEDNSDEIGCPHRFAFKSKPIKHCNAKNEFECENIHGRCVPIEARCNGTSECKFFEDELNCGCQKEDFFECGNKRCVPNAWLCDKTDDCGDLTDESSKACELVTQHNPVALEHCDGYSCKNNECIPFYLACNHKADCKDGSDEGELCGLSCGHSNCTHNCQETPKGGQCMCHHGYQLSSDGITCKDINECDDVNTCAQFCANVDGSYSCSCLNPYYMLRADKHSCKATGSNMNIVFSAGNQVRSTSGDLKEFKLVFSNPGVQVSSFDIDTRRNLIYWTSEESGILVCMNMEEENKIFMQDLENPVLVRVDWLTENVYFVENRRNIVICNLNTKRCAHIYSANIHSKITALAIDPLTGFIFWAEGTWSLWNSPHSIIRRSDCSGHKVKTILDQDLHEITDLTLDPIKQIVYWVDMPVSTINRVHFDGTKREMLIYTDHIPKSISLFEDKLYWSNDATGFSIFKCKILATSDINCESVNIQVYDPVELFTVSHQSKQINATNPCEHVKCDFICTPGSKGAMCVCEDGSQVEPGSPCDDAGHRKQPTFRDLTESSDSNISMYMALFILLILGLSGFYYYMYHYKKKPFITLPGFHFHNPLSSVTEVIDNRRVNVQRVQLEPGQHDYENPLLNEDSLQDIATNEVVLNYNDARSLYDSETDSQRNSIAEYGDDQRKKLIAF